MWASWGADSDHRPGGTAEASSSPKHADAHFVQPPTVSLPKGGGAIRGIGEKFAANPVIGTGSMSVPIATSPGRSGFGPQLSLSYDSGAGNGPFGFGWSLSLPSITRKTDKGLPRYLDAEESDVFILSGAEDLVPVLVQIGGKWEPEKVDPRTIAGETYRIKRYRPRIEGLFARIEQWTRTDGDVHWRAISKDNILSIYGKDNKSRIADPNTDPEKSPQIFSWLICETRDDKGNVILYEYKKEDGTGVKLDQPHERNRTDKGRTVNRYIKRIKYGNRVPLLDNEGLRPGILSDEQIENAGWMFEVVFDYDDHDSNFPKPKDNDETVAGILKYPWQPRQDPFSTYRAGFEVRTYRLCQRVLMFHHFEREEGVGIDCLVRSTDFTYSHEHDAEGARSPVYSFLHAATQVGYVRDGAGYLTRSLPPVEFEYSQPILQDEVEEVDLASCDNLPMGVDESLFRWVDLHGEGIPGMLTEQAGAWFYKRNMSPLTINENGQVGAGRMKVKFAPLERVARKPNVSLAGSRVQIMDLAGDGEPDVVVLDDHGCGLFEHDDEDAWEPFRPFTSCPNRDFRDPNLRFLDIDGDGREDLLITEDDAFVWHQSLGEDGFGPACRIAKALDEEKGPRLVFSDGTQSIYLADMSGDGLRDLVRIRCSEVCYWPNLGHCRFGAKVTMGMGHVGVDLASPTKRAPCFDYPDQFDQKHVRLADIDGSGTTDIIYLDPAGVRIYFNQSGNSWSEPQFLNIFPCVDDVVNIVPADLLGNGTACLCWSSPLPGEAQRQMRYLNLMGQRKPHLLVTVTNNLGADIRVKYAPSTLFYLQAKREGRPWITRLPFPVHVVERVETYDRVSGNRFVTRYNYHHGYFDGEEREFRGFGLVEQLDTEEIGNIPANEDTSIATNLAAASYVPPVCTKTWFHTGAYLGRNRISRHFESEYFREPGLTIDAAHPMLLDDTTLPPDISLEEEREACRALKGSMLRQEVYALDGSDKERFPYNVTELSFTIECRQSKGSHNRHAVFSIHSKESLTYYYERNPADPRVHHALTLHVDPYGNVLKAAAIGYGRRQADPLLPTDADRDKQLLHHITLTENTFTKAIIDQAAHYRTPMLAESRTYELRKAEQEKSTGGMTTLYRFDDLHNYATQAGGGNYDVNFEDIAFARAQAQVALAQDSEEQNKYFRRLIEHVRTVYRSNDLSRLLPLGDLEPLALPGEVYRLAFTSGLLAEVYGTRSSDAMIQDEGGYVHSAGDANWWIPSGRVFYSPKESDTPTIELPCARRRFFLPHRYRDPFGETTFVSYDSDDTDPQENHNLLVVRTEDAVGNTVAALNDYRILQPRVVIDPNGNRSAVRYDALGLVVGTAVMGKAAGPAEGDSFDDFIADVPPDDVLAYFDAADPRVLASEHLGTATTRIFYELNRVPVRVASIARETHVSDLLPGGTSKLQLTFSYSDGFGREIQKKIQAEPGPIPTRDPDGTITVGPDGLLVMTDHPVAPRWVGSGWTIFNNKGKPVRQFEPFFTDTHKPDSDVRIGVSPWLFYDPPERVVATLYPNHTYEKVVFDSWRLTTYDVNDTVAAAGVETGDPRTDGDIRNYVADYFKTQPATWQTWRQERVTGAKGPHEKGAAEQAAQHADTPTTVHLDALGRPFLTLADNGPDPAQPDAHLLFATRIELDILGNQHAVVDAKGRIIMRYDYEMLGNRIHQASMESGERWMLADVLGKPIRTWDSRRFTRRTVYDRLRRPLALFVSEDGAPEFQAEKTEYGEGKPDPTATNHRGRAWKSYDGAGIVTSDAYDYKGNLRQTTRRYLTSYKMTVDWPQAPAVAAEHFTTDTAYDALNRPMFVTSPDRSVYRPNFNEANLLERVEVNLRGAKDADGQSIWTAFVRNINYNAKAQRILIEYGSGAAPDIQGVTTTYEYDPLTFRLIRLETARPTGLNGPASQIFKAPSVVQDLRYAYDPAGNITRIEDVALKTIFHDNQQIKPVCGYTYDALYRLIEATGREHIGQSVHDFTPLNRRDFDFAGLADFIAHPNDMQAFRVYTERYEYDAVGNFDAVRHVANGGSWIRRYDYEEDSLIEPGNRSNRLTRTTVGNGFNHIETYAYTDDNGRDLHGCITRINGMAMAWDFKDQLVRVDLEGGGTAYYVYNAGGQRVRKVVENQNGTMVNERYYLGSFELYRELSGANAGLVRETLHVMDNRRRIAMVETRNDVADGTPKQLVRYQLSNHLGSASVEVDDQGALIGYEEYHPYGTTAFLGGRSASEISLKRYRYTGKERDGETGFSYHGARYYAPWLGRWMSCDPIGIAGGLNFYNYAYASPSYYSDSSGLAPELNVEIEAFKNKVKLVQDSRARLANESSIAQERLDTAKRDTARAYRSGSAPASAGDTQASIEANERLAKAELEVNRIKTDISRLEGEAARLEEAGGKLTKKIEAAIKQTPARSEQYGRHMERGSADPKFQLERSLDEVSELTKSVKSKPPQQGGGGTGSQGGGSPAQGGSPGQGNPGAQGNQGQQKPGEQKSSAGGQLMGAAGALAAANEVVTFFTGKDHLQWFDDFVKGGLGDPEARTRVGDNVFRVTPADHRKANEARLKREGQQIYEDYAAKEHISVDEAKRRIQAHSRAGEAGPAIGPAR
jgi:RHS repeat-associated protein